MTPEPSQSGFTAAWRMVTCRDCGGRYQCTPYSDYYGATTLTDGQCERCMLAAAGAGDLPVVALDPRRQS